MDVVSMTDQGVKSETSEVSGVDVDGGRFVPSSRVAGPMTSQKLVFTVLATEWHLDGLHVSVHGSGGADVSLHDWLPAQVESLLWRLGLSKVPVEVAERERQDGKPYTRISFSCGASNYSGGLRVVWYSDDLGLPEGWPEPGDPPF
jgi:hypothetical protein